MACTCLLSSFNITKSVSLCCYSQSATVVFDLWSTLLHSRHSIDSRFNLVSYFRSTGGQPLTLLGLGDNLKLWRLSQSGQKKMSVAAFLRQI